MMSQPIFCHHDRFFKVALYGERTIENRELSCFSGENSSRICLVKAAGDSSHPGFGQIVTPEYGSADSVEFDIFADATILTEAGSAAAMFTGDCCGLILGVKDKRLAGLGHCGRPAMTTQNKLGEAIDNIVTRLMARLREMAGDNPEFIAVTTGSICPSHFPHDQSDEAKDLVKPFKQFGEVAFRNEARGELNIPGIIRHQLINLGVRPENIIHDNLCTYDHPRLYSYRQACNEGLDKLKRNAVVVTLN